MAPPSTASRAHRDSRVLVFSQRALQSPTWHATQYEFEDVLGELDDVDLLSPVGQQLEEASRLSRRALNGALRRAGQPRRSPPWPCPSMMRTPVTGDHDLFFAVFHHAYQTAYLHRLPGWRERCARTACLLVEQWTPDLEDDSDYLRLLAEFDVVYVFNPAIVPGLHDLGVRDVRYLATGVDALRFSPLPHLPRRTVDCYNFGRGAPVTHRALLDLVERTGLTYVYDSTQRGVMDDVREHRALVANTMKRSQFFFAYRINDSPERRARTGGDEGISTRYFEAAAGGAVMLGSRPETAEFDEHFDWPDVVIPVPYDCPEIGDVLEALRGQPDRLARIRADSVRNSLLRHDWSHRWARVLADVGLAPTPAMDRRAALLAEQASHVAPELMAGTTQATAVTASRS